MILNTPNGSRYFIMQHINGHPLKTQFTQPIQHHKNTYILKHTYVYTYIELPK